MLSQDGRERNDRRRDLLDRRRRRQEEQVRACLLGQAADAGPAMIWVADAQGAIQQVNRRWVEYVGYEAEPGGDGWTASVHPDDLADFRAIWMRHVAERTPLTREYRLRRRDGTWRWVLDAADPRFDAHGLYQGHVGAAIDVTHQREALDELRISEARFRSFAQASDDLFWMADPAVGRITFANTALERIWGASRQTLLAEFDAYWRELIHPDDLARVDAATAILQSGRPRELQYRVVRPADGEERVVEDRAFPIRDEAGAVRMVGGILRDVTDTVRAREELERRVAERTAELEASVEQRRKAEAALAQAQRMETVGRLTGGVAHDFNNLLTVVIGALDMILRKPGDPERVERLGQAALEAGRRGERLTRQLLSFSRRQPLRVELVSLHDLILAFEPMLRGAVGEATPLSLDVPPEFGARLDKAQFEAALLNLVVNARAAVEAAGAGTVGVRAERARIEPGETPDLPPGDYTRVSVIDTGAGMDADVAAHAFEPFFTTRSVGQGSGLGLAQVYGFARQSGGAARIDSTPGQGTTVSLYLPLEEPPAPVQAPLAVEPTALPAGLRVLLVDDEPTVRAIVEKQLLDLGAAVQTAENGTSALAVLERDPDVQLLLTDVVMPGLDGVQLARAALALRPALKIVLSTGYASDRLAAADPAWPVLFKPYEARDLVGAVGAALGGGGTSTASAL